MKNTLLVFILIICLGFSCTPPSSQVRKIVANPINLNYHFQPDDPSRREAADPVCEYFNGKYYLFASKSGGYWSSPDLEKWTYIPCKSITTLNDYAPTIMVYENALYFMASGGKTRIFKTTNPDEDNWELVDTQFEYGTHDPAFYPDDDGRVYLYWGCSDRDPIVGIEVDPKNGFKAIGTPDTLILHNVDKYGWEIPGVNNEEPRIGWNEGPCMIKYNNKYYLQYAAPGTQYRIYGDGIYVGDNPLGPFVYTEDSPFSFKPGGYIGGAGHGHTFLDVYGNYWHVASMVISVRHMFERRLGLFPVYLAKDNNKMYAHTVWTDYPFVIPDKKVDSEADNGSLNWNLLSYKKQVTVSSEIPGFEKTFANDEKVETWWSAQSGNSGEWLQIDLGTPMAINAIQVNFADQDFTTKSDNSFVQYQYIIEGSNDNKKWENIVDRSKNTIDQPHELIVLNTIQKFHYLRITNTQNLEGKFSLSGFRVFGNGGGALASEVSGIQVIRNADKRRFQLHWDAQENTTGYIVRWGIDKNHLNNASMVFENQLEAGYFNRDSEYYFAIDAFNENGVTRNKVITHEN